MKLHDNRALFQDAVLATAQKFGIREVYIEKDYWVTYALRQIFASKLGNKVVFKGGTSLSKCYNLIKRFSEDIDLVALHGAEESSSQKKAQLKMISNCISGILPEVEIAGVTNKYGMIRKTAHTYPQSFRGYYGQVLDVIVIEATWLGHFEPYSKLEVKSLIAEMMLEMNQHGVINEYSLEPFEVSVLDAERTLCEKIMSLVRFSFTENPIFDLRNKVRHMYDIHLLCKDEKIQAFFRSIDFDKMLLKVAQDDVSSFKNNNKWLLNHPATAVIFSASSTIWQQIEFTYRTSFKELVFGEFPHEHEILSTLLNVSERLRDVTWKIEHK